jgi:hypothetical protein
MFYKHHSNLGAEQMSVVKDTKISNVYGNAIQHTKVISSLI